MKDKLSIVTINDERYLGVIDKGKQNITDAVNVTNRASTIRDWFIARELNKLLTIKLGKGASCAVRALDANEKASYSICEEAMTMAKKEALGKVTCDLFVEITNSMR